jgi:hypothetical protein
LSLDDWILALHVLSAFALVAAMVVFWVMVAVPHTVARDDPRLSAIGQVAGASIGIGSLGTIVFGTWLALSIGGYDLWDGWILAAYFLWVIGVGMGQQAGVAFTRGDDRRGLALHTISSIAVLLLLANMIWKPGA